MYPNSIFKHAYPYSDLHELNLDWIIKQTLEQNEHIKDFVNENTITLADPIEWSKSNHYNKAVIVEGTAGDSYLSLKEVPAGIEITNTEYWYKVANFNAQLAALKVYATPQMYGAKGDGITDDTSALSNAISHCISSHMLLYFPAGVYNFSNTIHLDKITMIGNNATLNYTGAANAIEIDDGFGLVLSGFTITTSTGDTGIYANGKLNHSLIEKLYITGFNIGIRLSNSYLLHISDVICESNESYGMYITEAYNALIERSTAQKNNINLRLESGSGVTVDSFDCSGAGLYAMQLNYVYGGVFTNIYYEDKTGYAATNVINTTTSGIKSCTFKGLYLSLENDNISYIKLDGGNDGYNTDNVFGGIVIDAKKSTQSIFNFINYQGYERCYNNVIETTPTYVGTIIPLASGDGVFEMLIGYDTSSFARYIVRSGVITRISNYSSLANISITTDSSGNSGFTYPNGASKENVHVIEVRDSSNDVFRPASIRYYSTEATMSGLPASSSLTLTICYTV